MRFIVGLMHNVRSPRAFLQKEWSSFLRYREAVNEVSSLAAIGPLMEKIGNNGKQVMVRRENTGKWVVTVNAVRVETKDPIGELRKHV